ncbi:hypothetical protein D3C77_593900 [compost metagenome]|jgi:hypothetical protein
MPFQSSVVGGMRYCCSFWLGLRKRYEEHIMPVSLIILFALYAGAVCGNLTLSLVGLVRR